MFPNVSVSWTQSLEETYNWVVNDIKDPRTDSWFLVSSPWPTIISVFLYYYTLRVWGPNFMKNREPFQLKELMLVYNLIQTVFNIWLFSRLSRFWLTGQYSWVCQPVDYSMSQSGLEAADIMWWAFMSKYLDFLDSFFFILRKKFNQLSPLHVVHHGIMPFTGWTAVRYVGGGTTTFTIFLNTFIHTVMYFYYFLAALGPQVQKYLWWKRHITKMQMIQFLMFSVNALLPFFYDCGFPRLYCLYIFSHGVLFFTMFAQFYVQAYRRKRKSESEAKKEQ